MRLGELHSQKEVETLWFLDMLIQFCIFSTSRTPVLCVNLSSVTEAVYITFGEGKVTNFNISFNETEH